MNIKKHIQAILRQVEGRDSTREGLRATPDRVERMYEEVFSGYAMDPKQILRARFQNDDYDPNDKYQSQIVVVKDIEFYSHCEHHMVPFFGTIHIGYIPGEQVVGISKFVRLVHCFSKRLQIQERLIQQIADAIEQELNPIGVMVVCEAKHLCMSMRGARNSTATTVTSTVRGQFRQAATRGEFLALIGGK